MSDNGRNLQSNCFTLRHTPAAVYYMEAVMNLLVLIVLASIVLLSHSEYCGGVERSASTGSSELQSCAGEISNVASNIYDSNFYMVGLVAYILSRAFELHGRMIQLKSQNATTYKLIGMHLKSVPWTDVILLICISLLCAVRIVSIWIHVGPVTSFLRTPYFVQGLAAPEKSLAAVTVLALMCKMEQFTMLSSDLGPLVLMVFKVIQELRSIAILMVVTICFMRYFT
jgi:hypothetical protein